MTAGWDFAPACRPTVRRSPSPLGLGESHSFQRPIPKPPEPPVEAQSSQFNPSVSMSRKAGTGGARRHVDRRGRPRVRRAPEGGQDRGSSRRARTRPVGAPSAPEALRAIAAAKFDLGPRPREPVTRTWRGYNGAFPSTPSGPPRFLVRRQPSRSLGASSTITTPHALPNCPRDARPTHAHARRFQVSCANISTPVPSARIGAAAPKTASAPS